MHTLLNRIAPWVLVPVLGFGSYFIYRDAASPMLGIVGLAMMFLLFAFSIWAFAFQFCVFDYAVFEDDRIVLYGLFGKKADFRYDEVIGSFALYTSILESKRYVTFVDKKYNGAITHVDTSKWGNTVALNKMKVVYVPATESLMTFLQQKPNLLWYAPKENETA